MTLTSLDVQTRPASAGDERFLHRLYTATRAGEFEALDPDTRRLLLEMQARAQRRSYELQYPGSEHRIVLVDGQAAGRIWLSRSRGEHRLVDISILPASRNAGIGACLVREQMQLAARESKPLRLRVHLRLGFGVTYEGPVYSELEWRS
jgi:hypothetical protein